MTRDTDTYRQLWQLFHQSTSVDGVIKNLKRLDDLIQSDEISLADAYELRSRAFRTLRELTVDDPKIGESLIFKFLLPYCLESAADAPSEVRIAISGYRNDLTEWLNQYAEPERVTLRDKVLDVLAQRVESPEPEGACWTIAGIGFRRPDIIEGLWKVAAANEGETGDIALSSLSSLGGSAGERALLLSALHQRAALRCTSTLIGSLRRLSDPQSVDVVLEHWLQANSLQSQPYIASLALRVLSDVADVNDADPGLQDRIWDALSELFVGYPDILTSDLHLGSDMAPRCNSESVVPFLIRWIGEEAEQAEHAAYSRWLLNLRLEECCRPRQLLGWKRVDESAVPEVLRQEAQQDTQYEGILTTSEIDQKRKAWNALLCLGYRDVLAWYEQTVAAETNPYLRQEISRLLADFCLDPLPPTVLRMVTEPFDAKAHGDSREWVARLAATEVAQSAATWEAFEALLSFGLTVDGRVLQNSADALAVVSIALTRAGKTSVVERLVETVVNGQEMRHRLAAASALEMIGNAGLLPEHHAPTLAALLSQEGRDRLELSELVAALGWLPAEVLTTDIQRRLETWAQSGEDRLAGRALETMARHGLLLTRPALLTQQLGLEEIEYGWNWASERQHIRSASFIVGLLYLRDPDKFTSAVVTLLKTEDWHSAFPLIHLLNDAHGKPDQPPLPIEVKEAMLERARSRQTRTYAETELFHILARLVPDDLAQQPWESVWDYMLPDARVALAAALGTAACAEPQASSKAISHLLLLIRDGQYAVRRAAYRGLAQRSASVLQTTCEGWSQAPTVELRQRAAEACAWLPSGEDQPGASGELYQRLAADPERMVREAAERAWLERRERLWGEDYLSHILGIEDTSNDSILAMWPYGQALGKVGDDACRQTLLAGLRDRPYPPHVRHWLYQIAEGIEKRWRKVTQKWPDPWLPWDGTIESTRGKLIYSSKKSIEVHFSLWQQTAPTPSQPSSWGGAAWPVALSLSQRGKAAMVLEDGRQGSIVQGGFSGEVVIFLGTGEYPA
jgi:hypothetical protein